MALQVGWWVSCQDASATQFLVSSSRSNTVFKWLYIVSLYVKERSILTMRCVLFRAPNDMTRMIKRKIHGRCRLIPEYIGECWLPCSGILPCIGVVFALESDWWCVVTWWAVVLFVSIQMEASSSGSSLSTTSQTELIFCSCSLDHFPCSLASPHVLSQQTRILWWGSLHVVKDALLSFSLVNTNTVAAVGDEQQHLARAVL